MGILAWLALGFLAGSIASLITRQRRGGRVFRIAVGITGALIGGALARAAGYDGVTDFGLRAVLVSSLGAVLLLLVLGAVGGRRRRRRRR